MANQVYRPVPGKPLSPELEALVQKLTKTFGPELHIASDGSENGIIIDFFGRTPQALFRQLELEQAKIFGPDMWKWQILCSWGPTPERGVQILCLNSPKERLDHLPGFWYY